MSTPTHADDWPVVQRAAAGDAAAWQELVTSYQPRLRRMIALRIDPRLGARVDPSDVVQESLVDAVTQLGNYVRDPRLPFFCWLRMVTGGRLNKVHRFHLGTDLRDARRDHHLGRPIPDASSACLADAVLDENDPPSRHVARGEIHDRLRDALEHLDPDDRQIITLRHFEHMSGAEAAAEIGITAEAAAKRYLRALKRFRELLRGFGLTSGAHSS